MLLIQRQYVFFFFNHFCVQLYIFFTVDELSGTVNKFLLKKVVCERAIIFTSFQTHTFPPRASWWARLHHSIRLIYLLKNYTNFEMYDVYYGRSVCLQIFQHKTTSRSWCGECVSYKWISISMYLFEILPFLCEVCYLDFFIFIDLLFLAEWLKKLKVHAKIWTAWSCDCTIQMKSFSSFV